MRTLFAACVLMVLHLTPALADTLVATRPGLMCASADALAKLTRPDGSSRAAGPGVHPGDVSTKEAGGCIDIPPGVRVRVLTPRKQTSIVTYDANDGRGTQTYVVPNIDFASTKGDGSSAATHSFDAANGPKDPFWSAMDRHCPQQRWDHAVMGAYEEPLNEFGQHLTRAQSNAMDREVDRACTGGFGMACSNSVMVGYMTRVGLLTELVRALCAIKPDTFD